MMKTRRRTTNRLEIPLLHHKLDVAAPGRSRPGAALITGDGSFMRAYREGDDYALPEIQEQEE